MKAETIGRNIRFDGGHVCPRELETTRYVLGFFTWVRVLILWAGVLLLTASGIKVAHAADQTVDGNLFVSGTVDFGGNSLFFGSLDTDATQQGMTFTFGDTVAATSANSGLPARFTLTSTRPQVRWDWRHPYGTATISAMMLDQNHRLLLSNTVGVTRITLDPRDGFSSAFGTSISLSGTNNTMANQVITGTESILNKKLADQIYLSIADARVRFAPLGSGSTAVLTRGTADSLYLTSTSQLGALAGKVTVSATNTQITGNLTVTGTDNQLPGQLLSGSNSVLTLGLADARYVIAGSGTNTYLTTGSANSLYAPLAFGTNAYLTTGSASVLYAPLGSGSTAVLTRGAADDLYLASSSASLSYLAKTDAAATYLTADSAKALYAPIATGSSGYLTQATADGRYVSIGSGANAVLTQGAATGQFASLASVQDLASTVSKVFNRSDSTTQLKGTFVVDGSSGQLLVAPQGDIPMGEFTSGPKPEPQAGQ